MIICHYLCSLAALVNRKLNLNFEYVWQNARIGTFSGKGYIHIYKYTKHSINNENTTRVRATPFVTVQEGVGSLEDMAVKDILLHLSPLTDMNYCALAAVGQPESELPAPAFKNISFVICI